MNKVYKVYPGGKHKVLTLSYDDGKVQDRRLVEIFNKYGIKATFNLNSGLTSMEERIKPEEWKELYAGHEVAVHTYTHPTLARTPKNEILFEYYEDRKFIESVVGHPVRGLAYPNGSANDVCIEMAKAAGLEYGRLAADRYSMVKAAMEYDKDSSAPILLGDATGFEIPSDYMRWLPTCHHNHDLMGFGKRFMELHKTQYLYMMYVWGHSFEFDKNNDWNIIEEFCEMIGGRDDIWYATNIEIVDYNTIFNSLQFTADNSYVFNPCAKSAWLKVNDETLIEVKGGEGVKL
jgi:peptidoglycan/xylan/chitin deacetylase (PgdA/CDA1 family)